MPESREAARMPSKKRKHDDDGAASAQPPKKSKADKTTKKKKSRKDNGSRAAEDQSVENLEGPRIESNVYGKDEFDQRREGISNGIVGPNSRQTNKDEAKKRRKEAKKARKQQKKSKYPDGQIESKAPEVKPSAADVPEDETQRSEQRRSDKKARRAAAKGMPNGIVKHGQSIWTLSPPSAGRFLDQDPIFVQDRQGHEFLIAANEREVQLLDLETSLVALTYPAPLGRTISCFNRDTLNEEFVDVGCSDGSLSRLIWSDGYQEDHEILNKKGGVVELASAARSGGSPALLYISTIRAQHVICDDREQPLFFTKQKLLSLKVLGNGEFVVSRGPKILVLGQRKGNDYIWIEIPLATPSTCVDARLLPSTGNTKKDKQHPGITLALGHENGQIHLFSDLSSLFTNKSGRQSLPTPRILHWHREAVSSVKFSRDGNYIISGGKETVLVLWQLSTAKEQFLPHLTAEIERIVVNERGDRYAVQLADNSIMVLSTSELKPVAHFAGLQVSSTADRTLAAVLNPRRPNQMLLSVPSSRPRTAKDVTSRPFLQTFDTRHSRHISRQALTRNNVTDLNIGPERTPIIPPDVILLAISFDGSWLATVDEWMPPSSDLKHLGVEGDMLELERQRRREVYLKIWTWNEQESLWTLSTRMDSPHARANGESLGAGRVLALVADPISKGFASIGEDNCVKFWMPKKRRRHGVVLKDTQDIDAVEWSCKRVTQLPRSESQPDNSAIVHLSKACLAYSTDGSLLAVAQTLHSADEAPVVNFIDTSAGVIAASKSGLANSEITAIGFLERYFVAVSHPAAYVWDLVNETLMYRINLSYSAIETQLAISPEDNTFALVSGKKKIEIYEPRETNCLFSETFDKGATIEGVLTGKGTRGYVLIFEDVTIRTIAAPGGSQATSLPSAHVALPSLPASESFAADPNETTASSFDVRLLKDADARENVRAGDFDEDDRPVVRPEQLADVFDVGQSFAMPPVKDMFQAVVGLFGRRPQAKVTG